MSNWFLIRDGKTIVNSSGSCSIKVVEVTKGTDEILIQTSLGAYSFFIGDHNDAKTVYENLVEDLQNGENFIIHNTAP